MQETFSFNTETKNKNPGPKKRHDCVASEICRVPECKAVLQKGPKTQGFHLYQAVCIRLRRLSYVADAKWVAEQGITCFHCFSVEHSNSSCQFKDTKSRRIVKVGYKEQRCNKDHHVALHDKKNLGKLLSLPTKKYLLGQLINTDMNRVSQKFLN